MTALRKKSTITHGRNNLLDNFCFFQEVLIMLRISPCTSPPINILPAPAAQLPALMQSSTSCERCYMNRECMLNASVHSEELSIFGAKNSHKKLLNHFTGHLSHTEMQYFSDWDRLIDLEAYAVDNEITKSWLVDSVTREKNTGTCMSFLTLNQSDSDVALVQNAGNTSLVIRFDRGELSAITTPLNVLRFDIGCRVVISTDCTSLDSLNSKDQSRSSQSEHCKQLNILRGSVEAIEEKKVFIRVSRNGAKRLNTIIKRTKWTEESVQGGKLPYHTHFRLDKIESTAGITTLRQNIVNLFTADIDHHHSDDKINVASSVGADQRLKHRIKWLRRSIIHLEPAPKFDAKKAQSMFVVDHIGGKFPHVSGCDFDVLSKEFNALNEDQKNAVTKVRSKGQVYMYVVTFINRLIFQINIGFIREGLLFDPRIPWDWVRHLIFITTPSSITYSPPLSRKTSTIAFIARLLAARGNRVLITSYTHAAVDNLLIKLMNAGVGRTTDVNIGKDLIRIGPKSSCHVDLHEYLVHTIASNLDYSIGCGSLQCFNDNYVKPSVQSLSNVISSAKIVGVSALTIPKTPLLSGQHFDYVICDEAGQISQPAIIGALMAADSFVLVGDHEQLPPLVQNNLAKEAGQFLKSLVTGEDLCLLMFYFFLQVMVCLCLRDWPKCIHSLLHN